MKTYFCRGDRANPTYQQQAEVIPKWTLPDQKKKQCKAQTKGQPQCKTCQDPDHQIQTTSSMGFIIYNNWCLSSKITIMCSGASILAGRVQIFKSNVSLHLFMFKVFCADTSGECEKRRKLMILQME